MLSSARLLFTPFYLLCSLSYSALPVEDEDEQEDEEGMDEEEGPVLDKTVDLLSSDSESEVH